MLKRTFDLVMSLIGILVLLPFLFVISLFILFDSKGGILYKQVRVGKNNQDFLLLKFRTMCTDADKKGLLTVGLSDSRVTRVGKFLRKYKLDELPQLFNILKGDMSLVGPRPEVRKYVSLYSVEQLKVLNVKPGLTDFASIEYMDESDLLAQSENPEQTYINEIMPAKLNLNFKYIEKQSFTTDLSILFKTVVGIFR